MKAEDKFGNSIYSHIFNRMKKHAKKLKKIGFEESKNKPNLFYKDIEGIIIFADMRGYKRFHLHPIWGEERKGSPRFYHKVEKENIEKWRKTRILLREYKKIRKTVDYHKECIKYRNLDWKKRVIDGFCKWCGKDIKENKYLCEKCKKEGIKECYNRYVVKCEICETELWDTDKYTKVKDQEDPFDLCGYLKRDCAGHPHPVNNIRDNILEGIKSEYNISPSYVQRHHVSYDPEKIMKICSRCHGKIHNCDEPKWNQYEPERIEAAKYYNKVVSLKAKDERSIEESEGDD